MIAIWIIRWEDGRIRSFYGEKEDAEKIAKERGIGFVIV